MHFHTHSYNSQLFTGFALIFGTFVKWKMIRFLTIDTPWKTAINGLILFEQLINIVNGPVIFMQLLKIFNPEPLCPMFANIVFCRVIEATVVFAMTHRSLGGTVIAGVRQVQ